VTVTVKPTVNVPEPMTAQEPAALALDAVHRRYGDVAALRPLTMSVGPGAVVLVEGPNGAGKSTLLRLAAGLLRPTGGVRRCEGRALYLQPGSAGRAVEQVRHVVRFAAAAATAFEGKTSRSRVDQLVGEALAVSGLEGFAARRVGTLSSGERGRLSIAVLLASRPVLACLDEPAVHLDAAGSTALANGVQTMAEAGTAVLVAAHDPAPFLELADARLHLEDGLVRARGVVRPARPPQREATA
jgi:ABC-type multidrug transport system ATPase subunit